MSAGPQALTGAEEGSTSSTAALKRWDGARSPRPDDVRLVVADMDGTLLDGDGAVPDAFWPLLDTMRARGITFSPASGRQYATLAHTFAEHLDGMAVIAENGTLVVRDGVPLSTSPLPPRVAAEVLRRVRDVGAAGRDVGVVVCGRRTAYIDRTDAAFVEKVEPYYRALDTVPDLAPVAALDGVDDDILKVAVFDFDDVSAVCAPALAPLASSAQVVVSGLNWMDVMADGVSKGGALQRLQAELGITPEQTVAFGDYLNDLEMLEAAAWSYAMADAHPILLERARLVAPSHLEHGVLQVLGTLLDPTGAGSAAAGSPAPR